MSKSNREIWDAVSTCGEGWEYHSWTEGYQKHVDTFAEAIREDQRLECGQSASRKAIELGADRLDGRIWKAILNAGKAPVLKPGMLVKRERDKQVGVAVEIQESDAKVGAGHWFIHAIPLTKAEIQVYMDKAPE